ncbi:hypothetical protein, partial [Escherichia coli]
RDDFFHHFAPVKQFLPAQYAASMPCFYYGYFLTLRPFAGQNPDEKQPIVKIDVSKGQGM